MDSEANESAEIFRLVAWAHANQKRLIIYATAVAVVAGGYWLYTWSGAHHQRMASEALSDVRPSAAPGTENRTVPADAFLKVAEQYPGTASAGRAVLLAAGALFDAGKYAEAQAKFEQFLRDAGDSPWRVEAQIGVAASLEAAGKNDAALSNYKAILDKHPSDATTPQVKFAMARLNVALNKPDQALRLYEEMARVPHNDSWSSEAEIEGRELLQKHPELRPPPVAPTNAAPAAMMSAPAAGKPAAPAMLSAPATPAPAKAPATGTPAKAPAAGTNGAKP